MNILRFDNRDDLHLPAVETGSLMAAIKWQDKKRTVFDALYTYN